MKNYLIFILLTLFASCNKQLKVLPTTQEVDGNIITDLNSARIAINGVYYTLAYSGFTNSVQTAKWFTTNEVPPAFLSGMYAGLQYYANSDLYNHVILPTSTNALLLWSYGYSVVNAANGFLKNINTATTIDGINKRKLIAEALFLRAYANANLLFYFGQYYNQLSSYGIILRKEFLTSQNISLPRSSVGDCYDFILSDVDSAINNLPSLNSAKCYANLWAAKLLKARILMVRGAIGDYRQVSNLCKDIITNSPFLLEDSSKNIFLSKGISSNEVILGIQPYTNQVMKSKYYYGSNQSIRSSQLMDSLFQNDPRNSWMTRKGTLVSIGSGSFASKYCPDTGTLNYRTVTTQSITEYGYAFRLTEAYLLQAEAMAMSEGNKDSIKLLLNTVLLHAGYKKTILIDTISTNTALQYKTVIEEMKNMVGEAGQEWFALRRLPLETIQKFVPSITSINQFILPIPNSEIIGNIFLQGMQNPGYGGN